jgi:tetratricopeptide (TPR) repeat protein
VCPRVVVRTVSPIPICERRGNVCAGKGQTRPVAIENVTLPFRFRGVQTPSLLDWDGSRDSSEFRRLVEDISAILGPTTMRRAEDEERRKLDEERLHKQARPSEEEAKRKDELESRRNLARKYPWQTYGLAAAAVAVMLIIFSFVFWPKPQGATEKVMLLLADFDGPDPKDYRVTETISNSLELATKKYDDVEIKRLYKSITDSKIAQTEGKKRKADIVLWGWYVIPGNVVTLSVHFEVLNPPKEFPELGQAARGDPQLASIADLKGFALQPRLSDEMNYLSLFVLGMARRAAGDGKGAIDRFSDALAKKTPSSSLNHSIVYFYRGLTYMLMGDSDHILADLNQAIKLQPTFAEAYVNRALIYVAKGDYSHALVNANQAVQLKPDSPVAYNNRGLVYLQTDDYDRAIADFSQALKLLVAATDSSKTIRPDSSQLGTLQRSDRGVLSLTFAFTELSDYLVYNNRGFAYLSKGDHDRALADFNQAIKLQPNRIFGYFNRATAYFTKQDYDRALANLNQVIKLQP